MISIDVIETGMMGVNCSLVSNLQTKEIFLVDPGDDEETIYGYIKDHDLNLRAILHTHAHFDHILGTNPLVNRFYPNGNVPIYLHPGDQFLWDNVAMQGQKFGLSFPGQNLRVTHQLHHNEILNLCGLQVRVLNTPGHSPGSCTFLIDEVSPPVLICGDVLFHGSIGRTDLWQGDFNTLIRSIRDHILTRSDETRIIPGHGPETTVGEERTNNPFLGT